MGSHAELERRNAELEQQTVSARVAAPAQVARRPASAVGAVDVSRDLDVVARQVQESIGASSPDVIRRTSKKNQRKKKAAAKKSGKASGGTATAVAEAEPAPDPTPEELAAQELERRETEQLADGSAWQSKIQAMSRPEVGPHAWSVSGPGDDESATDDGPRKLPVRMQNRRGRQLGEFIANHPAKIVERADAEQREIDDAPYRSTDAQAALTTKEDDAKSKVDTARKAAKAELLSVPQLGTLLGKCSNARSAKSWYELDNLLDEVDTEAQKTISYLNGLVTTLPRILALPEHLKKKRFDLRAGHTALRNAVSASPRDDTAVSAQLQKLLDDLQALEDAELAKDTARAGAAAEAARRAELRRDGRWPGNDKPAAEIATANRADVGGSDDERAAVIEAINALKTPALDHSWARKWADRHGNGEGNLPGIPGGGGYLEYYVRPPGSAVGTPGLTAAGARRLVVHTATGRVYYSHNHYGQPGGRSLPAFVLVTDA